MATIIGGRWRALDEDRRAVYEALAKKDKLRYKREMALFKLGRASETQQEGSPVVPSATDSN